MEIKQIIAFLAMAISSTSTVEGDITDDFFNSVNDDYRNFENRVSSEYASFRDSVNADFAQRLGISWEETTLENPLPRPKDKSVPPRYAPIKHLPPRTTPTPIDLPKVTPIEIPQPQPEPQPTPIVPIEENTSIDKWYNISFYGTNVKVRWDENLKLTYRHFDKKSIPAIWNELSSEKYNNLINDCLSIRDSLRLDDWPYLELVNRIGDATHPNDKNASSLLSAFLFCQSGYAMRLGIQDGKLISFYGSIHKIYDSAYIQLDNMIFIAPNGVNGSIELTDVPFPGEKPLSLEVRRQPKLTVFAETKPRQSKTDSDISPKVSVNKNLIDLYNKYPTSIIGDNFMTRWAQYANTPLDECTRSSLYPHLRKSIKQDSEAIAANKLLHFVQTAFEYEYDDKVWGGDRAFFAEESLYYPYCDCEDRSILFSRLVRDILNLDVALIFYPGHLATAVAFTDSNIGGDWIMINNRKFMVCDPTYIFANIGMTMPNMDNSEAKALILER